MEMSVDSGHLGHFGRKLGDAGYLLERATHAVHPASSTLGRVVAVVSVVKLGVRLIPVAGRLFRQHPVASLLVVAGFLGTLYLARPPRSPPRLGLG